jgi:hypothetical protein
LVSISSDDSESDANYNKFEVRAEVAVVTGAPDKPIPLLPAAESSLADAADKLTFVDPSASGKQATWYELWVYDENNVRVTDIDANPTYANWYKVLVDDEVTCTTTSASGQRLCTIDIKTGGFASTDVGTSTIGSASDSAIFRWWVKGYNSKGDSGWSAISGSFKK